MYGMLQPLGMGALHAPLPSRPRICPCSSVAVGRERGCTEDESHRWEGWHTEKRGGVDEVEVVD
jgi:hypothetical protein